MASAAGRNRLAPALNDRSETTSAAELHPAYLIAGTDAAKIDAAVNRLRSRAEREGGAGSLEQFAGAPGAAPDAAALAAAVPAMSLIASRRYLLADGVERWSAKQAEPVIEVLAALPEAVTVVLVAREQPPKLRAPKKLVDAVEKAGGRVLSYVAPKARALPGWLREQAKRRGFELDQDAAALLVERMGEGTTRLATELDRLAVWAAPGERIGRRELAETIADTSEEVSWSLSDAIVDRDAGAALEAAERLTGQGEAVTPLVYGVAKRLREAAQAIDGLDAGRPPKEVEASLSMHPYAAKLLVQRVRSRTPREVRASSCAIADLEWWTRGGSDYPEAVALTLAVRRAAGRR